MRFGGGCLPGTELEGEECRCMPLNPRNHLLKGSTKEQAATHLVDAPNDSKPAGYMCFHRLYCAKT